MPALTGTQHTHLYVRKSKEPATTLGLTIAKAVPLSVSHSVWLKQELHLHPDKRHWLEQSWGDVNKEVSGLNKKQIQKPVLLVCS